MSLQCRIGHDAAMRWKRGHTSGIEDRRAQGGFGGFGMGGGGGMPIPVGVGGGAGVLLLIAFVVLQLLGSGSGGGSTIGSALDPFGGGGAVEPGTSVDLTNQGDMVEFMGYVLDDANALWADTFERSGLAYEPTILVLFEGGTMSGCGAASSQTGPFYCPLDRKVYVDLDFFRELSNRFGAPGDFAQAYVLAHEVAHHVQQQTGIESEVRRLQQEDPSRRNSLSVSMELQADCLAGVWAQSVYRQGDLERGDLEEGLRAASAVGDDRIQAGAGAAVNPETWTHGSAEQRSTWFNTGFDTGDPAACDTFSG
jgi:predicted metalloprotease